MSFPERDQFLEILRENGHRVTSERLALFGEVYAQHGHLDAEALLASISSAVRMQPRQRLVA